MCQFIPVGSGSSQVHRPAACDCISDDPADQADVYLEDRPEKAKRLCCCSSCATSEILTTEVQDTSMAKRSTENARCNLGCRNPTLTHAAAQKPRQKHHCYLGFPKALSTTGEGRSAEPITDDSSMPMPSLLGATQDSHPGPPQTSKRQTKVQRTPKPNPLLDELRQWQTNQAQA